MSATIDNKGIKGEIINGCEVRFKITSSHYDRPYGSYSITAEAYASCLDCGGDWQSEKSEDCYDLSKMGEASQAAVDACLEELTPKCEAHRH
jgi:hypothetical protein